MILFWFSSMWARHGLWDKEGCGMWWQKAEESNRAAWRDVPATPQLLLPLHPPPYKAQILPVLQNGCPHSEKQTLFPSWECFFPNQPGRKGDESVSTAEVCEAGTAGGAHCTTQFAWCLSIPLSKVSPSRLFQIPLARILGMGPREWSWLLQVGYGPPGRCLRCRGVH